MSGRRYPIGAEVLEEGGVSFRVWAPRRSKVEVVLETGAVAELAGDSSGYFSGTVGEASAGDRYRYRLDGGDTRPDPTSRFQPEGPHGPSEIVDPSRFRWSDSNWKGCAIEGQVLYEMHIGTFTREGNWEAARRELPELAELGITVVELMPVSDFPGKFGWGYDGVGLFAPVALYGTPDELRAFVNEAHRLGLGVVLDVVYNHVGPFGNYLNDYSEDYFSRTEKTDWGGAINFDGENSAPVREWVLTNVAYWAQEYHLDGLRLDATQSIYDKSPEHIITAISRTLREAAQGRQVFTVAENEPQQTCLARPIERGGMGLDGLWNDDFHHSAMVAITGHNEAYYTDYLGRPQELISAVKYGYLYQGQRYQWQAKRRGTPSWGLRPAQFVNYVQNHDQVANTGRGCRMQQLSSPGRCRAITALLLLAPGTPMIFQGQEFAASKPFYYFADHEEGFRALVREGRIQQLWEFPSAAQVEMRPYHKDPSDPATFEASKLDLNERKTHAGIYRLHKDLLRLRREDPLFHAQQRGVMDGAVLGEEAFLLRFFGDPVGRPGDDRLVIVNLGRDLRLEPAPEPLLAPVENHTWELLWSSESPVYGGNGTPPVDSGTGWRIPGHAAVVLRPGKDNLWRI